MQLADEVRRSDVHHRDGTIRCSNVTVAPGVGVTTKRPTTDRATWPLFRLPVRVYDLSSRPTQSDEFDVAV